jgi:hypothetical protein
MSCAVAVALVSGFDIGADAAVTTPNLGAPKVSAQNFVS